MTKGSTLAQAAIIGSIPDGLGYLHFTDNGAKITPNPDKVNREYLKYFLQSRVAQDQMANMTTKIAQPKLTIARIETIHVALPPMKEQVEIQDAISSADAKLRAEESRRRALDTLFTTLLRDLMTGKRRVQDLPPITTAEVA